MSLEGMVVVKEEVDRFDAENVAAFLRSEGIDAMVNADDAGGTIPALDETRFAQVLVKVEDAERARAVLAEREAAAEAGGGDEDETDGD